MNRQELNKKIETVKSWLFWEVYPNLVKFPDGDYDDSSITNEDIERLIIDLKFYK